MKLHTKKMILISCGFCILVAGCILISLGEIEISKQSGPGGSKAVQVMWLGTYGIALVVIGPLLTLRGVLTGYVPKWVA